MSTLEKSRSAFSLPPASGYNPSLAHFLPIKHPWCEGDLVELDFGMPIMARHANTRLRGHKKKVAVTRGPLVYCLENIDNREIDIFKASIDSGSILPEFSPTLLGGIWILRGKTKGGRNICMIPYYLWANRGESQMTVWINT